VTEKTTPVAAVPAPASGSAPRSGPAAGTGTGTAPATGTLPPPRNLDQVTVKLPAEGAYLSVLRTATAGLAARLDFTLDEIEDLRIAVDEACAMLLAQAVPGTSLECNFILDEAAMTIEVSADSTLGQPPAKDTFAWTVLSALAGNVDSGVRADGRVMIVLRKTRGHSGSAG
jgi:serine/threonine-protein kinase RsbW